MIPEAELIALLAKCEKATPGPWDEDVQRLSSGFYAAIGPELMNRPAAERDASFLKSAQPHTVAALVREVLAARQAQQKIADALFEKARVVTAQAAQTNEGSIELAHGVTIVETIFECRKLVKELYQPAPDAKETP